MTKPVEKVKITRTRKRIYEMSPEEVAEMPVPQEVTSVIQTVAAVDEPVIEETAVAAVVPEAHERPLPPVTITEPEPVQEQEPVTEPAPEPEPEPVPEPKPVVREPEPVTLEIPVSSETPPPAAPTTTDTEPVSEEVDETFRSAMSTVHTYSALSAATGLIPLPFVDMAGFMAMQLLMLKKLCELYGIPFDSQRSKSAIAILASGINSAYVAASSSKLIPFIGAFSIAAMPAVNGALSYAVGRVFIQHFASGGTFLDFDPNKVRGYFEEQYRSGKVKPPEKP